MIELSPPELHNYSITFDDAKLYIFTLGDGWRLPSNNEACADHILWGVWDSGDYPEYNNHGRLLKCIPVRDLKND